MDPEYDWLRRTCLNAFNVYLTMTHLMIYDSTVDLQPNEYRETFINGNSSILKKSTYDIIIV